MEDSETKTAALEKVAELEDELGHVIIISNKLYTYIFFLSNAQITKFFIQFRLMIEWLNLKENPCQN